MVPVLSIDVKAQIATLYGENSPARTYVISTALSGLGCEADSSCTPIGKFRVAQKIGAGLELGAVLRQRVPTGEIWSADPSNSLSTSTEDLVLTRILWLEGAEPHNVNTRERFIYLHGTNQEALLGQPASHGCVRFRNTDIIDVFDRLPEGAEVQIR
jgi:lipoprotein-anchoring transpeptidase ErfK/SrfK